MEFTDEELETLLDCAEVLLTKNKVKLFGRVLDERNKRRELAEFVSDCGDSCRL